MPITRVPPKTSPGVHRGSWTALAFYEANDIVSQGGQMLRRQAAGFARAAFDATEQGLWASFIPDAAPGSKGLVSLDGDLAGSALAPSVRTPRELIGSKALQALDPRLTPAAMATPPTFPARTTGLSIGAPMDNAALALLQTATGNGALTVAGLKRTNPNFADPKSDLNYRIRGPFTYFGGSTATTQQVGNFAIGRKNATPEGGMTGGYGSVSFRFQGRYLVRIMRDISGVTGQFLALNVSKNGGPFQPHRDISSQNGQEIFSSPGDGLYYLQLIDFGSVADWAVWEELDTCTFGGYYALAADAGISYPNWRAGCLLVIGDSFSIPGEGQYRNSQGFVQALGKMMGMEVHLSGQGGTGYRAKGFISFGPPIVEDTLLNYGERLAYDVDRYFDDAHQPDAIVVLGSQNDRSGGFAGTPALDTAIDTVLRGLRERFPKVPIQATGLMHLRTETWNAEYETINSQIKAWCDANPKLGVRYGRSLLQDLDPLGVPVATMGTGFQGSPNGTGPSDTLTWTDSSHPSPITAGGGGGQGAIADKIARNFSKHFPIVMRPDVRAALAGGVTIDASQVISGVLALARIPALDITRMPSDQVAKATLVRRWTGKIDGTNSPTVADRTLVDAGQAVALGAAGSAAAAEYVDPADPRWVVAGKALKFFLRVLVMVGDVASNSGIGVVLLEVGAPTGGAAGADLAVSSVATISGSTGMNIATVAKLAANARLTPADSEIAPADFVIPSAKWVVPRLQNFTALTNAGITIRVIAELWARNV